MECAMVVSVPLVFCELKSTHIPSDGRRFDHNAIGSVVGAIPICKIADTLVRQDEVFSLALAFVCSSAHMAWHIDYESKYL